MPRPPKFTQPTEVVNVRLPADIVQRVDAAAQKLGLDRSRFLRAALFAALARTESDPAPLDPRCPQCLEPMVPWTGQTVVASGLLGPADVFRCDGCRLTYNPAADRVVLEP